MTVFAEFSLPLFSISPADRFVTTESDRVQFERIVPSGSQIQYLWVDSDGYEQALEALRADSSVVSVDLLDELPDRVLVRLHLSGVDAPILDLVSRTDAFVVDATGTLEGWRLTLRFPTTDSFETFVDACDDRGLDLELHTLNDWSLTRLEHQYGLTDSQYEALSAAFEAGYFDVPRGATLAELAGQIGISEQAFSERLRRGLARFLIATLADGSDDN